MTADDGFGGLRRAVEGLVEQLPEALNPGTETTKFGFDCFAAEWLFFTWCRGHLPRAHAVRIVNEVRDRRASKEQR